MSELYSFMNFYICMHLYNHHPDQDTVPSSWKIPAGLFSVNSWSVVLLTRVNYYSDSVTTCLFLNHTVFTLLCVSGFFSSTEFLRFFHIIVHIGVLVVCSF